MDRLTAAFQRATERAAQQVAPLIVRVAPQQKEICAKVPHPSYVIWGDAQFGIGSTPIADLAENCPQLLTFILGR
jgi:hypothetical protein